jgi:hypothetical protein
MSSSTGENRITSLEQFQTTPNCWHFAGTAVLALVAAGVLVVSLPGSFDRSVEIATAVIGTGGPAFNPLTPPRWSQRQGSSTAFRLHV